jgi:dihydropteroate synthase
MAAHSPRLPPSGASPAIPGTSAPARFDAAALKAGVRALLGIERAGTLVMGVVNATPDSFHAASRAPSRDDALAIAERLLREGADLLDVGGESTRPGAAAVAEHDERARVVPAIAALRARGCRVPISVDTCKSTVARAAIEAGATLINDVSGGLLDPGMPRTVAELGVPVVIGHLRGTPATMTAHATYDDVVDDVRRELASRIEVFAAAGVARERILVDPGVGFAKTAAQNLVLLRRLDEIARDGRAVVIGVSRKRFVAHAMRDAGLVAADDASDRLAGSLAAAVLAAERGAAIIRAHDVAETRRALAIADAILHEA